MDEQPDDEERLAALLAVLALGGTRTGGEALGRWRADRSARTSRAALAAESAAVSARSPRRV